MVGRCYRWDGRVWRVITRWRDGRGAPDQRSWVCDGCGQLLTPGRTLGFCDCGMGAACWVTWRASIVAGYCPDDWSWHAGSVLDWARFQGRAPRNVLLEDVETGQRLTRPFRGLRRC